MSGEDQKAVVKRCASEISRGIYYFRAWSALKEVERRPWPNFIHLAELAFHDQMIAHACKVLGRKEEGGFFALRRARQEDTDSICERLSIDLKSFDTISRDLKLVRDKTHFHLDLKGAIDPKSIWLEAQISPNRLRDALLNSFAIICELYKLITGEEYPPLAYDGSDAKAIAEHANKHDLLFGEALSNDPSAIDRLL